MNTPPRHQRPLTMNEALFFGFLVHRFYKAQETKQVTKNGYFPFPFNACYDDTPLGLDQQVKALDGLKSRGYIKTKLHRRTGVTFYKLIVDRLLRNLRCR